MNHYYSFNTRRNGYTNLNNARIPTPPTPLHHILHNSIQNRNFRNLLRRGVRSSMINRVPPKPTLNNNS